MSIVLYRVDERLIHGQVVVGWAELKADRFIVIDDALAQSQWEQELYTLGLPGELTADFVTVAQARASLKAWQAARQRIVVLTRDLETMQQLARDGALRGVEINIGGIHHAAGRRRVLPYVYLSATETDAMTALSKAGAVVSARDLPASRRVGIEDLIRGSSEE